MERRSFFEKKQTLMSVLNTVHVHNCTGDSDRYIQLFLKFYIYCTIHNNCIGFSFREPHVLSLIHVYIVYSVFVIKLSKTLCEFCDYNLHDSVKISCLIKYD